MRGLFSLSASENTYFDDKQDKFELVGTCPHFEMNCHEHISHINNSFLSSNRYWRNKDYPRSIEALKSAYYKTDELQQTNCIRCAELFRTTITQSLENIHEDLQKIAGDYFWGKRYQPSFKLLINTLLEFRKGI